MARDRTARARIRQLLATGGPVVDSSGFATGILKEQIDYGGSPVAFIQLIAAMEQDGEIEREIRGKRTYRISATAETKRSFRPVASPPATATTRHIGDDAGTVLSIDYDQLAKALVKELWSVVTTVVSAGSSQDRRGSKTTIVDDDYARKLATARQALDDLFSNVEAKAEASATNA